MISDTQWRNQVQRWAKDLPELRRAPATAGKAKTQEPAAPTVPWPDVEAKAARLRAASGPQQAAGNDQPPTPLPVWNLHGRQDAPPETPTAKQAKQAATIGGAPEPAKLWNL